MRLISRGDMDGLASAVLLTLVEDIKDAGFAHPKDMQDGKIPVTKDDIVVNLPYVNGCGLWFDHHVSEHAKLDGIGTFKGKFEVAPSCARVIYNHYKSPKFEPFMTMLTETDRLDSAQLTPDDVTDPKGWILLGYTLDPRSGFGPEFRKYFRWLTEFVKELPIEKVLQHPEVKKRCERFFKDQEEFTALLNKHCRMEGNVVLTDFRSVNMKDAPVGSRFLVFTLFPEANVEVRLFKGLGTTTVAAVGHSIFNRTCKINVGEYLATFGGGGHRGAGTCQLPPEKAEEGLKKIIAHFRKN
ncbi:MAG: hypothetical protein A2Z34_10985 [Planctomycetes bacterium RBG_16_59_8]|nr:MAG: hypothetical protein A2Z34_10985 [Planctomycetes bacterium RBG_16_59_8]